MRIAIIGAGGIGRGYAVLLAREGHAPVFWSPTGAAEADFAGGKPLTATGILPGELSVPVAASSAEAIDGAEVVIIAVTANGFRRVMEAIAPQLAAGQTVIVSAHCSFAALYLAKLLAERGLELPIVAWSTTAVTARKSGPTGVHISGVRSQVDIAAVPKRLETEGLAACRALFGDRFALRDDVLAIMLSNLNPPAHMANMLGNLTRAEKGEDWPNYGSITPAVGRIVEAMDRERLALAAAFGLTVRTVQDHYALSFGVEPGPVSDMAQAVYRKRPELLGPKSLDTRFITEDVPFGLLPLERLGAIAGVPMPLHQAGIELFSAISARGFRAENDLLPLLDLDGLSAVEVHRLAREGWAGC
ncbi:NAD/NADP octopine/nopaline dehydrogenase family protein [Chelatococcus sp. GCM10030263]|uniref:NAD/NADP octopine/nopaline dehydrogenase family protein n=1 Tax=Chelatococcus sp. GCM10030263 TaxID=3273387 RepID=UPI0036073399